jgi:NarL family two-component system response regulator LiaR
MASKPDKIRVMLVDDHDMLRSGLKVFLDAFDDLELVGEASDGEQAVWYCQELSPDVVLMDLNMPRLGGIDAIKKIHSQNQDIKFVVLTSFVDEELVQGALQAGAVGYLLKDSGAQELYAAIHRAHHGQSMLSPQATQALVSATVKPPPIGHDLSNREIEILELLVQGLSNSEIGDRLYISRSTVKNHISSIFGKLHADSRAEAAAIAVQYGIARLPDEE